MPGIDFSNDPLLQGRLFSYLDTQLSRLGSPNFHQIPINAPKCPFANHQRDGHMQMARPKGNVAHEPTTMAESTPRETPSGFHSAAVREQGEPGEKGRVRADSFADHYSQARLFYRSQTVYEQAHLASALVFELSKVERRTFGKRWSVICATSTRAWRSGWPTDSAWWGYLQRPHRRARCREMSASPALQIIGKMRDTLEGRSIGILIADGSDGAALLRVRQAASDAGATVTIVAPKIGGAQLADGSLLAADGQLAGTPSVFFDAVAVVLSEAGAKALVTEAAAIDFVRDAYGHLKAIGVDRGGSLLLARAGVESDDGGGRHQEHRRLPRSGQDAPMEPRTLGADLGVTPARGILRP